MSAEMPNGATDLAPFVDLMRRHHVEFLVIGGQAEAMMGSPRVTYDTDLCYKRTKANLQHLAAALRELKPTYRNAPPDLPVVLDEQALALGDNYTFNTSHGQLDLLGWIEPIGGYEALAQRAETFQFQGAALKTISLDDLIRVKQHLGRSKDRDSLLQLLAIKKQREDTGLR